MMNSTTFLNAFEPAHYARIALQPVKQRINHGLWCGSRPPRES